MENVPTANRLQVPRAFAVGMATLEAASSAEFELFLIAEIANPGEFVKVSGAKID